MKKRCTRCGKDKPRSDFYLKNAKKSLTDTQSWCKRCMTDSHREWRRINAETARASARRWNQTNPERIKRYKRSEKLKLKREVMDAYGGVCACCGEERIFFLSLDHVDGDGAADRRTVKRPGSGFYYHLKKLGFPDTGRYQVLCYNCNLAKKNLSYCPCRDPEAHYQSEVIGQLALFSGDAFSIRNGLGVG